MNDYFCDAAERQIRKLERNQAITKSNTISSFNSQKKLGTDAQTEFDLVEAIKK
jgi:hypothetical protein